MKILSFDVGIKNLAYCLFDLSDHSIKILDWKVIDITNQAYYLCESIQKKKKVICGSKATYKDNNNKHYCKTHAKSCEFLIPKPEFNITQLKNIAKEYSIEFENSIKKTDLLNLIIKFQNNKMLSLIPKPSSHIDMVSLCIIMTEKFNQLFSNIDLDLVLIENQIGNKAVRMKCLQGMITQYFIFKNIHNIQYISSMNKLKYFLEKKQNLNYKERKHKSIEITLEHLTKTFPLLHEWSSMFNSHSKKDDLADAYLQGLWYIKEKKLI